MTDQARVIHRRRMLPCNMDGVHDARKPLNRIAGSRPASHRTGVSPEMVDSAVMKLGGSADSASPCARRARQDMHADPLHPRTPDVPALAARDRAHRHAPGRTAMNRCGHTEAALPRRPASVWPGAWSADHPCAA